MTQESSDLDVSQPGGQSLAVIYLRVSTKEQAEKGGLAEGYSIPAQREALERKAKDLGAVVVAEFVDAGESAKSADRPNLQRMLAHIEQTKVDYVIVHKVDRLARNRKDDVDINVRIVSAGAKLVSATENIDETPTGKLMHGMLSSFAEFYSNNLATEVHKGMGQKAKMGGTPGKAPLGYLNVGKLTDEGREVRTVIVDQDRADIIRWAFKAYATGEWTLRTMADELEALGLRTRRTPKLAGKPVAPNILNRILRNPYYKGLVPYQGVLYEGNHESLVDEVTWHKVQDVLDGNAVGEKQRVYRHYLKSSVWCGRCTSRLIITVTTNRYGNIYPYFVCLGRQNRNIRCTRRAVLISKVERMVEDYWASVQLSPDRREELEAALQAELQASRAAADLQRKSLTTEKTQLINRRKRLMEATDGSHLRGSRATRGDRLGAGEALDAARSRRVPTCRGSSRVRHSCGQPQQGPRDGNQLPLGVHGSPRRRPPTLQPGVLRPALHRRRWRLRRADRAVQDHPTGRPGVDRQQKDPQDTTSVWGSRP